MEKVRIYIDGKEVSVDEFIKQTGLDLQFIKMLAKSNIPLKSMDGNKTKIVIEE